MIDVLVIAVAVSAGLLGLAWGIAFQRESKRTTIVYPGKDIWRESDRQRILNACRAVQKARRTGSWADLEDNK